MVLGAKRERLQISFPFMIFCFGYFVPTFLHVVAIMTQLEVDLCIFSTMPVLSLRPVGSVKGWGLM
jgi:hypothetical protein